MAFKTLLGAVIATMALAASQVGHAQQYAETTRWLNLRAGPATQYPVVIQLPPAILLDVHGCLANYAWCDVSTTDRLFRGWVSAAYLAYPYQGVPVPVTQYGAFIGLPVVTFILVDYWRLYYRERAWYRDWQRWDQWHRLPPPHRPPPPPYRPDRPGYPPPAAVHPRPPTAVPPPRPVPGPRPEAKPLPAPEYRPPRPPQPRPEARPLPAPEYRPSAPPQPRPEARPLPAPEQRPAPPPPRPETRPAPGQPSS